MRPAMSPDIGILKGSVKFKNYFVNNISFYYYSKLRHGKQDIFKNPEYMADFLDRSVPKKYNKHNNMYK